MSREFKFRAWDKTKKNIIFEDRLSCFFVRTIQMSTDEENRFKIMQYTGLKDKNEKEIYEGDILEDVKGNRYPIKYAEYQFYGEGFYEPYQDIPDDIFSEYAYSGMKIIGNIYENPELIKEGV